MFEWIVPPEDSEKKMIAFLTSRLGDKFSARLLKRALESNRCQVNGKVERFASSYVCRGDHVILNMKGFEALSSSTKMDIKRILYEDDSILVYNKPAGVNCDEKGILEVVRGYHSHLQLIHRLDRDTTGVLLFAKSQSVFELMVHEFKELRISKCYLAIVDGLLEKKEGEVDNYLGKKHSYEGQTVWGSVKKEEGLHALTYWKKIRAGNKATLVFCYPKTGRTHQIRVHLAGMGHPILGDFHYCKRFISTYRPNRYLLHAYQVSFIHPVTKKEIEIEAPVPEDFQLAQQELFGTKKL